jgi:hypothetical protein
MMGELSTQRWDYLYSYLLHLSHILEFFTFGLYASLGCRRLPFFQRLLGVYSLLANYNQLPSGYLT